MEGRLVVSLFLLLGFCSHFAVGGGSRKSKGHLNVGFYNHSCPRVEEIVGQTVMRHVMFNPGISAGLIRLHFHDCFIRGCDASILLDATPTGEPTEKESQANGHTLRGLDVIDEAKAQLEAECPSTVSCADILAFAARDAAVLAGLPRYPVLSGRRDGNVSLAYNTIKLPSPFASAEELTAVFAKKGITQEEMVVLSGAHSIGQAHCPSFDYRLHNFKPEQRQDPSIDPLYAEYLKVACPEPGSWGADFMMSDGTVKLDSITSNVLDNGYYAGLTMGRGLLTSDQALMKNKKTRKIVRRMAFNPWQWAIKFGNAMHRLGAVDVLMGDEGEVRRFCRHVN
ncbi:peroxidase 5-like [Tasmannia lanceolata]|uniref:peroxidase 5-like n=1 Tax=Tasmannia lanceolata TaxID=3420 RepID=UPI004063B5F1